MGDVVRDFLARRYAQRYVELWKKKSHRDAEAWARKNIKTDELKEFQKYVIKELKKQGFTDIKPGPAAS